MIVELRSLKRVCTERMRPSPSGTAPQMSGTPSWNSWMKVARRPASARSRSSSGISGSSILAPNWSRPVPA